MPSFGVLPGSMPPDSSSLTLVSSNTSSAADPGVDFSACPPLPDGCMPYVFGSIDLPPPPPLSLPDAVPYSPPPAYPQVLFGPPLLPSARFPPPPPSNPSSSASSYARPVSNITSFEGPQSHYAPEPQTAYDRWSADRNANYTSLGGGDPLMSKSFSHWALPTFNPGGYSNNNRSHNGSPYDIGFVKPEALFPYPPVDSVADNFGPKFGGLPGFPNAAGMPPAPSAALTTPLAPDNFGSIPPPNLPLDFPYSSASPARFPFNPHASAFVPGMESHSASAFGSSAADFMPEPVPPFLSRAGAYQPSSSFQAPDHFLDPSPHPIPSPETTTHPRPLTSDSLSSFYGPPPQQPYHGSWDYFPHTFPHHSDTGVVWSSEGVPLVGYGPDSPAPFTAPYPPPHPLNLFSPYASAPPLYQESPHGSHAGDSSSSPKRSDDGSDRIVGLMSQHLSPEEWRWKHYEPSFLDVLDSSGTFARVRSSGYNHFLGIDSTLYSAVPNASNCLVATEEGSSSGASGIQNGQEDIVERSKEQNQSGPSLKLAASALAEMLASGSNGASGSASRNMLSQIEATSGTALSFEGGFNQAANSSSGGQARSERMLEDCCSSSGSAGGLKDGRDYFSCSGREFGELRAEACFAGLNLGSPRWKREISNLLEGSFCDLGGAASWGLPTGKTETSTDRRPVSRADTMPQSAKGGAIYSSGQRRVFSKGSAGIMRQPSVTTGSAKLNRTNADVNSVLENCNAVFTQSSNLSSRSQSARMRKVSSSPVGVQPADDPASFLGPLPSIGTAASGLSLFGPHQEMSSGITSELPLYPPHKDQCHANSTSCVASSPLSQAYLGQRKSITESLPNMGAASRVLANLQCSCPESSSQTEVAYLGKGFHSLTASISNLSKVLFSLDSSALTPPDSAALEESLQSSILRLSECLLLEQARISKNPATRFVGSDESSAPRNRRADGSLPEVYLGRHAKTEGRTNLSHLKASEAGIVPSVSRSGSPLQFCNVNDLRTFGSISPLETVDPSSSSFERDSALNNDDDVVSKSAINDVGIKVGNDSRHCDYNSLKRQFSPQQKGAMDANIIEIMRQNQLREAKFKILVKGLREKLEHEREENRGTALLCEKIMQEAEVSKGKAVMQGTQKPDFESKKGNSTSDKSSRSAASLFNGQQDFTNREKGGECELGESDSRPQAQHPDDPFLDKIDQVEARLALLRARPDLTAQTKVSNDASGGELRDESNTFALENSSEDAFLNNSDQEEALQTLLLAQIAASVPKNISHDPSENVESRLALLQAQPTGMHEPYSTDDTIQDIDESVSYPVAVQSISQETSFVGMEARLALLHGRPGWDNELGVFTETEPCTPGNPAAVDWESGTGSFSGHSEPGLSEERVAFAAKALKAMSHITSQLLIQSETISNMHTAWSHLSEQVNSKSVDKESNTELQQKEADTEIANANTQAYGGIEDVKAQGLLIRSRPDWTDGDASESEIEDFLGGPVSKISSANCDCVRCEGEDFETINEISLVRLLDSDVELFQPLPGISTDYPSLQAAFGDGGEGSLLENPAMTQDSEDESGWEHVRFPQKDLE